MRRTASPLGQIRRALVDLSPAPPFKYPLLMGRDLRRSAVLACASPARICSLMRSAQVDAQRSNLPLAIIA
eukprot:7001059-Pyramimonas_sp.AAC.1